MKVLKKINLSLGIILASLTLLGMIVGVVIKFVLLESKVDAQDEQFDSLILRERTNKDQFIELVKTTNDTKEIVTEIYTNQGHIMRELGIEIR